MRPHSFYSLQPDTHQAVFIETGRFPENRVDSCARLAQRSSCALSLCPLAGRRGRESWRPGAPNRDENGGRETGRGIFQANNLAPVTGRVAALRGHSIGGLRSGRRLSLGNPADARPADLLDSLTLRSKSVYTLLPTPCRRCRLHIVAGPRSPSYGAGSSSCAAAGSRSCVGSCTHAMPIIRLGGQVERPAAMPGNCGGRTARSSGPSDGGGRGGRRACGQGSWSGRSSGRRLTG